MLPDQAHPSLRRFFAKLVLVSNAKKTSFWVCLAWQSGQMFARAPAFVDAVNFCTGQAQPDLAKIARKQMLARKKSMLVAPVFRQKCGIIPPWYQ